MSVAVSVYIALSKKRARKQRPKPETHESNDQRHDEDTSSHRRRRQHKQRKIRVSTNIRYNHFNPMLTRHVLIREGIVITGAPDEQRDALTEAHLFHFKDKDESIQRSFNKRTSKYTGVFQVKCSNNTLVYVHPLDADWKVVYADRDDAEKRFDILSDGTPYWTDLVVCKWNNKQKKKIN